MTDLRIHSSWTTTAAIGTFVALLTLLAVQMRVGRDPALGAAHTAPVVVAQVAPRRVLIKRVVRRVIDEVVIQEARPSAPAVATQVSSGPAVVQSTSIPAAPVYVAPAAPAPAPIVTRTS